MWVGVIWTATSIPGQMLPEGPLGLDRVVHFWLYVPLGFLLLLTLTPSRGGWGFILVLLAMVMATGAAMAALDEWHQQYIPNRTASMGDWRWDVRGIITGSVMALPWLRRRRRRKKHVYDPRDYR